MQLQVLVVSSDRSDLRERERERRKPTQRSFLSPSTDDCEDESEMRKLSVTLTPTQDYLISVAAQALITNFVW